MAEHTIITQWDEIPADADPLALTQGAFRTYRCTCGADLPDRAAAEAHAVAAHRCSACLGAAATEIVPGFTRPCASCAGTGRRGVQLRWRQAHEEAARVITLDLVRDLISSWDRPFRLSEAADAVRRLLRLPPGRLPVGPRVRDLLRRLEADGELVLVSAPDRLLHGTAIVFYDDPQWQHADRCAPGDPPVPGE